MRIVGVDLPNKPIAIALTYIYGIGRSNAMSIVQQAQVDPQKRADDLTEGEHNRIVGIIQRGHMIEGQLRGENMRNRKRLLDIGCYRGLRHRRSLPAHGQRTKTNARTCKGPRKTVVVKKKAPTKT